MEEKKLQEVADVVLDILWEKLTAEYGEEKTRSVLFENYDSGENYGTVYILPDIEETWHLLRRVLFCCCRFFMLKDDGG